MINPARDQLVGLQQLRFIAALLVLIHHVLEELHASPLVMLPKFITTVGACGVDIFFVISGYVMWHSTRGFSPEVTAGDFMRRRIRRIFPIYWSFLCLILLLWSSGLAFRSLEYSLPRFLSSIFLLPGIAREEPMVMGVAWTLVYEMYFYALCSLTLLFPRVRWRPACIAVLMLGVPALAGLAGLQHAQAWYSSPLIIEFGFGLLLGASGLRIPLAWRPALLTLAGLCFLFATRLFGGEYTGGLADTYRWWTWGLPALLVVACSLSGSFCEGRAGAWLSRMGDASYTLYLSHAFVMIALARLLKSGGGEQLTVVILGGSLSVIAACFFAALLYFWLEQPLTRQLHARRR
ncbi:acyltransferase [Uliginosibacterium sp. 31-12]|uniref:acyltransferase family protein n=1 Tax=Uliginosibacterium sp. 31-12 TaxID=3062781 RepID=UPI0026E23BCC|nr:acyltransferase [Uliginosibacterium sp. 31-12]MDO6387306.1 acyltransferase [Uliginosibacterium sp. 31-12]